MTSEEAIVQLSGLSNYCAQEADAGENGSSIWYEDITALDVAILALREQLRWVNVDDKLPEINTYVLCKLKGFHTGGSIQVCKYRDSDKYVDHPYFDHFRNGFPYVTHWMHLPKPPKED